MDFIIYEDVYTNFSHEVGIIYSSIYGIYDRLINNDVTFMVDLSSEVKVEVR